jgi:hypothetical protein
MSGLCIKCNINKGLGPRQDGGFCHRQGPFPSVTAPVVLLRYSAVGIKRVITMAKNIPSKSTAKSAAAKDTASRSPSARKSLPRARPEKKRVRRVVFKSDQWYANAAMSIGIAGRAKGARPVAAAVMTPAKDQAE